MNQIKQWLIIISKRQDIMLAAMLLLAVLMMIIPLPTWLIDFLIAFNLMMAITLLMMALYIKKPLEFSVFPAVLLITTLYRLALSISTTRLILLQADAGEIIYTFGEFAVGGNLGVGLIVFLIITIVQFIVITKGSERVAEVSARFSLDAMPGKQMSIDGDLRAGTITAEEARDQRNQVQQESQLFGAMDGAMKFVKGDAIAGIIITLVNILGGTAIGVLTHGMSASTAISVYAILSIGDGLISQIPALLISITAGIIVTRISGTDKLNLASELAKQIGKQNQALMLTGVILLIFGIIPGFPTTYFVLLSAIIFFITWWMKKYGTKGKSGDSLSADPYDPAGDGAPTMSPGATPLIIQLSPDIGGFEALQAQLEVFRFSKFEQLGIPLPEIALRKVASLPQQTVQILLYQEPTLEIILPQKLGLVDPAYPPAFKTEHSVSLPFNNRVLHWVTPAQQEALALTGIPVYQNEQRIIQCLSLVVDTFASEFIGVQESRFLMDSMEGKYAELVKEVQRQLPVGRIANVLQRLVGESVSIRDLRSIFEALIEWAPREKDAVMLVEYVRMRLRRHLITQHRGEQTWISGWMIGDGIENQIREATRQTAAGSYSSLDPVFNQRIVDSIRDAVDSMEGHRQNHVLITAIDVRRFLRKVIEREFWDLRVLSFQEIGEETEMRIIGNIDIIGDDE